MPQQISPQTVATLRSMKKTAIIVLLLFSLAGPVTAKRVAELLDIDYQTVRKYLRELSALGVTTETPIGWVLLQGGPQLILPPNAISETEREKTAPGNAKKSRSDSPAPAACPTPFHMHAEEEAEEEETKNPDETRKNRVDDCLACLEELGINGTKQVLDILENDQITAEYIDAQAERLESENRWSTGLLLTVMRCFDPIPQGSKAKRRKLNSDGRSYCQGAYKEFVET